MAQVKNKKTVCAPFPNTVEIVRVRYDFSVDGGAVGKLDLIEAADDIVIVSSFMKSTVAGASGGSATVSAGPSADADNYIADTAVAALTVGAINGSAVAPQKLAKGDMIQMEIATAALTAGVIEFAFVIAKA